MSNVAIGGVRRTGAPDIRPVLAVRRRV